MWKILGLALFCCLLGFSEGKKPAIRSVFSEAEYCSRLEHLLVEDGTLQSHLKGIVLGEIQLQGLLGLLGKITGLNIVNVEITARKAVIVPGLIGGETSVSVRLDITGSALLGLTSLINISVELSFSVRYELANFVGGNFTVIIQNCDFAFGAIDIKVLDVQLSASSITTIQNSIIANINAQICGILQVVFNIFKNLRLESTNVVLPFYPYGNLKCQLASIPAFGSGIVVIDLLGDFDIIGQGILSIPDTAADIILPSFLNRRYGLYLHSNFLNIFFSVLGGKIQPKELQCIPNEFSGADALRAAVLALIPGGPSPVISASVLNIRITAVDGPLIQITQGALIVQLSVQIEFYVRNTDGSTTSIIILRDSLSLTAAISVTGSRLIFSVTISGHKLLVISSGFGIAEVSSLESHLGVLLGEIYLPEFNGLLAAGLPLPSVLGVVLANVSVEFIENAVGLYF